MPIKYRPRYAEWHMRRDGTGEWFIHDPSGERPLITEDLADRLRNRWMAGSAPALANACEAALHYFERHPIPDFDDRLVPIINGALWGMRAPIAEYMELRWGTNGQDGQQVRAEHE